MQTFIDKTCSLWENECNLARKFAIYIFLYLCVSLFLLLFVYVRIVFANFAQMKRIILITGGQRSGKSVYAEKMALALSDNPVYVATAHIWDDEFKKRVDKHKERRKQRWENIEEELFLGTLVVNERVVLVDCLTLWATNFFFAENYAEDFDRKDHAVRQDNDIDVDLTLEKIKAEFKKFTNQNATFIFVTNEIGCGGVSSNKVQRRFTDLLGSLNQYVAQEADEVYFLVSGIPIKIK